LGGRGYPDRLSPGHRGPIQSQRPVHPRARRKARLRVLSASGSFPRRGRDRRRPLGPLRRNRLRGAGLRGRRFRRSGGSLGGRVEESGFVQVPGPVFRFPIRIVAVR
jgi:hypothetical protein